MSGRAGGAVVAAVGPGAGFLIDAGTFAASFACLAALRVREVPTPSGTGPLPRSAPPGYVRSQTWLWATLVGASLSLLVFWGPEEVLVPYIVKNDMAHRRGLRPSSWPSPDRRRVGLGADGAPRAAPPPVNFIYWAFGFGALPLCLYALASHTWQLMVLGFVIAFSFSAGMVVWSTMMQTRVPRELLGRVTSLDWFVSRSAWCRCRWR